MEEIVYGMNKFKEYFKEFSDKYIIVGGTATAVYLTEKALRVNDIDKAQAHTLYKLSRALYCEIEDLLESPEKMH